MGPIDYIYNPGYEIVSRGTTTPIGHTSVYDGTKWTTTTTTTSTTPPTGISWTGTSTSSTPPAWRLPKVDLLQSIDDMILRNAVEDILNADKTSSAEVTINNINSAITLLSKKVVQLLGEE